MDNMKPLNPIQKTVVGVQFLFVAFGATVLVPLLVGLDPSTALFTAGIGTLIFHLVTKGKVPIFLGSSFAFVAPIIKATELYGLPGTMSGLVAVGTVYGLMSLLVRWRGIGFIKRLFPPVVIGPVIILIGLSLAGSGVNMAKENWPLALVALLSAILASMLGRGMLRLIPIFCGIIVGYLTASLFGLIDFKPDRSSLVCISAICKAIIVVGSGYFYDSGDDCSGDRTYRRCVRNQRGDGQGLRKRSGTSPHDVGRRPGMYRRRIDRRSSRHDLFGGDRSYFADKDYRPGRYPYCCRKRYHLFCVWEGQRVA